MLRLQADRSLAEGRVTRGEAARKNAFRVGHYKDFTEPETAHKESLGTQGYWIAVLEKIVYWRCVFPVEHKSRQNKELKIVVEKANNFHSTIKFTAEMSEIENTFLDTKVYKGVRFNKEPILDGRLHKRSRGPCVNKSLSRTRVNHQAWRNASLKGKRWGV